MLQRKTGRLMRFLKQMFNFYIILVQSEARRYYTDEISINCKYLRQFRKPPRKLMYIQK